MLGLRLFLPERHVVLLRVNAVQVEILWLVTPHQDHAQAANRQLRAHHQPAWLLLHIRLRNVENVKLDLFKALCTAGEPEPAFRNFAQRKLETLRTRLHNFPEGDVSRRDLHQDPINCRILLRRVREHVEKRRKRQLVVPPLLLEVRKPHFPVLQPAKLLLLFRTQAFQLELLPFKLDRVLLDAQFTRHRVCSRARRRLKLLLRFDPLRMHLRLAPPRLLFRLPRRRQPLRLHLTLGSKPLLHYRTLRVESLTRALPLHLVLLPLHPQNLLLLLRRISQRRLLRSDLRTELLLLSEPLGRSLPLPPPALVPPSMLFNRRLRIGRRLLLLRLLQLLALDGRQRELAAQVGNIDSGGDREPKVILSCEKKALRDARADGQHRHRADGRWADTLGAGVAHHFERSQRREERLFLFRVLRQPRDVGAAVHHALLDLKHHTRHLALAVLDRHLLVGGRRHEAKLDASDNVVLIFHLKLRRQRANEAAVQRARHRQLGQLDHRVVDQVQRANIDVAHVELEVLLCETRDLQATQHGAVALVHRAGVEARRDEFISGKWRCVKLSQLAVALLEIALERLRTVGHPRLLTVPRLRGPRRVVGRCTGQP
mmetsp:Transcript_31190/g.68236  ORF Transcript_31190/g.68236 Transcript_31190/m.68236 type:complete len:600 (-) Transcript_31190:1479-3278(-)